MQLTDQVAISTGSARGIGRATALCLAREGARIVVTDIDAPGAQEAATWESMLKIHFPLVAASRCLKIAIRE